MTAPMTPVVQQFWNTFKATQTEDVEGRFFEVCVFDDNEPSANHLAELVVRGIKRATAGLVWSFEAGDQAVPKPGDLTVVTTWDGRPKCVIETTQVDITPFCEVTAEFASVEGEGDGSLQYWREAHKAYYARECARIGRIPSPSMPVACERFKVVYCPSSENAA